MFRHGQLLLVAVLILGSFNPSVIGRAEPNEITLGLGSRITSPEALNLPEVAKLSKLQQAYLDAYSILSHHNACTNFFGGSSVIYALNGLMPQIRSTHLDRNIAIVMKGEIINVRNLNGLSYRLFRQSEINLVGPFYQDNRTSTRGTVPSIGGFEPNTREVRVTVLLHEMGHLVRGANDQWLLPDDGTSESLSRENTARVIAACGEQIRNLRTISFESELAALHLSTGPAELVASKE